MKTVIVLEIEHTKPLPNKTPLTDVVSQRVYGYLYSQGVEAGVRAALAQMPKEPGDESRQG